MFCIGEWVSVYSFRRTLVPLVPVAVFRERGRLVNVINNVPLSQNNEIDGLNGSISRLSRMVYIFPAFRACVE
jgi:hypothetical protein